MSHKPCEVWCEGRQIKRRDEVEAARGGAEVRWKASKTTSYRRRGLRVDEFKLWKGLLRLKYIEVMSLVTRSRMENAWNLSGTIAHPLP